MKIKLLLSLSVALLLGAAMWWVQQRPLARAVVNPSQAESDQKLRDFKQLCEYYLREEFGLSKTDPFPKLGEREIKLLSSGYSARFEMITPDASGENRSKAVACEMNEWADRFVITTYY